MKNYLKFAFSFVVGMILLVISVQLWFKITRHTYTVYISADHNMWWNISEVWEVGVWALIIVSGCSGIALAMISFSMWEKFRDDMSDHYD